MLWMARSCISTALRIDYRNILKENNNISKIPLSRYIVRLLGTDQRMVNGFFRSNWTTNATWGGFSVDKVKMK
jgi:hypothetical protein